MQRVSIVVVVLGLLGCGRTGIGEFDTVADQGATDASTDTSASAGTSAGTDTGAVVDLPPDDPEPTGTSTSTGTTGTSTGTTGDGDPGDGDPDPTGGTTTGGPQCGNGVVELGEQCDGADLAGQSCESLGYDSGDLGCDPVLCVYDASACMIDMGPGGTTG